MDKSQPKSESKSQRKSQPKCQVQKKSKIYLFSTDHFSPLLCSECSVAYNAIVLLLMDLQCIEAMKLEFAAVTTLWLRMFLEVLLVSEASIAEAAC